MASRLSGFSYRGIFCEIIRSFVTFLQESQDKPASSKLIFWPKKFEVCSPLLFYHLSLSDR